MFHKDKPIDWLLHNYLSVKVCSPREGLCKGMRNRLWYYFSLHSEKMMWGLIVDVGDFESRPQLSFYSRLKNKNI